MFTRRVALAGGLAVLLALGSGTAASAAVPENDVAAGAVVITALPFTAEQDTTQATTDAGDALLNASCGAPVTDASVWYTYTATATDYVSVRTSASDYSGGVLIAEGSPQPSTLVACGQGGTAFLATAGLTYWFMAIDDQLDLDGRNGGTLRITVEHGSPTVDLGLTVDRFATVDKAGIATVTGTLTCSGGQFVDVYTQLTQAVGRIATIRGEAFTGGACEGTVPWSVQIQPYSGKFAGGKAASLSFLFSCNVFVCETYENSAVVQLRRGN